MKKKELKVAVKSVLPAGWALKRFSLKNKCFNVTSPANAQGTPAYAETISKIEQASGAKRDGEGSKVTKSRCVNSFRLG